MSSLNHAGAHLASEPDVEKQAGIKSAENDIWSRSSNHSPENSVALTKDGEISSIPIGFTSKLAYWNAKVESLGGLEARGITRVLPEEKHSGGLNHYLQMFALWFSINVVATNIITGLLGPLVFQLGWVDCVCIVIFATGLSSCGPAYTAMFGPTSGNRTMVSVDTIACLVLS